MGYRFRFQRHCHRSTLDINADGVVNIQDLVLVAARLGEMWDGKEDVNRDGVVNILDLVLVANAF